jgi:outer membrane protein OmpA-like peptidoglycan-associated protein
MSRRSDQYHQDDELNVFQAFTDLMSNAFMIITFLLFFSILQIPPTKKELESPVKKELAAPIIIDEKSGDFKFPSGSAELRPDLLKHIQTNVIPEIQKATQQGNVDFIQVIGHTDSQGISNISNLDVKLTSATAGREKITALKAGSNADLGLMRAVAAVQLLQQAKGLEKVKFRAYSAGQLYLPSESESTKIDRGADDSRRRIEIRFIPYGQRK